MFQKSFLSPAISTLPLPRALSSTCPSFLSCSLLLWAVMTYVLICIAPCLPYEVVGREARPALAPCSSRAPSAWWLTAWWWVWPRTTHPGHAEPLVFGSLSCRLPSHSCSAWPVPLERGLALCIAAAGGKAPHHATDRVQGEGPRGHLPWGEFKTFRIKKVRRRNSLWTESLALQAGLPLHFHALHVLCLSHSSCCLERESLDEPRILPYYKT